MVRFILFSVFLGPHRRHMEACRPRGPSELRPPACSTAAATRDRGASATCAAAHSSAEPRAAEPGQEQTCVLMGPGQIRFGWATTAAPLTVYFKKIKQKRRPK